MNAREDHKPMWSFMAGGFYGGGWVLFLHDDFWSAGIDLVAFAICGALALRCPR